MEILPPAWEVSKRLAALKGSTLKATQNYATPFTSQIRINFRARQTRDNKVDDARAVAGWCLRRQIAS